VQREYVTRGYGGFATRKEKVSRWTRPQNPQIPTQPTQLAMAAVLGIPAHEVLSREWPHWLLLGLRDDHAAWSAPWTAAGALAALDDDGGPVDRRGFLIASTSTVAAVIAQWGTALPVSTRSSGQRIGAAVADRFDTRLAALRLLDDDLGADHVYDAARAEIRLIRRLLNEASYSEQTGRRLFSAAAEASRLAGWCAYDNGHTAAAEKHFAAALRAAASAGDDTAAAVAAGFWANVRYSGKTPHPGSAVNLIHQALARGRVTSPRVVAMLLIRQARAHSIAGDSIAAYRAVDSALSVYEAGVPADEDLATVYWVNAGEVFQAAGSAALSLGEPARALEYFAAAVTHPDPYNPAREPRGAAIYEARRASAFLALGDIDGAVETARQTVELMGGVNSARGTGTLADLRAELGRQRRLPVVADFLHETN
jgi:tetratricopeptide (TPR) repeat protein